MKKKLMEQLDRKLEQVWQEMEICHADPNWSAPCEYDDEPKEEEKWNIIIAL